ncbi:hypothetical protein PGT21_019488 [Puccinia graminis f. sp. tritici]|uniref:RING-type domain-containing protein n=1 Tax=Puccinia graminis f. sp. tritici TaxID=56615 RepID=A0A5B0Q676_PUCGR|nr:hypothetical protein PGT21_019488 [Puccinia graminis f. sp. tritici]
MSPLVQIFGLMMLLQVSIVIFGLPFEYGATSSSGNLRKLRQSCKSLKRKCSLKSVRSGTKDLDSFGSTSSTTGPESMPVCSICSASISERRDLFLSPTCIEGHAIHQGCVDAPYLEGSACPACQAVARPSIQPHESAAPSLLQKQESAAPDIPQQESAAPSIPQKVKPRRIPKSKEAGGCAICLEEWSQGDVRLRWPSCGHFFHLSCVKPWRKLHATCPVCRKEDPELVQTSIDEHAYHGSDWTQTTPHTHTAVSYLRHENYFMEQATDIGTPAIDVSSLV